MLAKTGVQAKASCGMEEILKTRGPAAPPT
jgi:hypothetical protein